MTREDLRKALHVILTSHDEALTAIRAANDAMRAITDGTRLALDAHDAAITNIIDANRTVVTLLGRLEREDIS